jgi:hypothetical protein
MLQVDDIVNLFYDRFLAPVSFDSDPDKKIYKGIIRKTEVALWLIQHGISGRKGELIYIQVCNELTKLGFLVYL